MAAALRAETRKEPGRVLLVEDDVLLREVLAETMRDLGLTVIEAANADEARRYLAGGGAAALVLSDVEMPGTMDGIALGQWVRTEFPGTALILTSGRGSPPEALATFVPKPFDMKRMAEIALRTVAETQGDDT